MLYWAAVFLIIGLVCGIFGFWELGGTAMWIAKALFIVFIILFLLSLVSGRRRRIP